MIELTREQAKGLDGQQQPAVVVDPRNGQEYLLVRRDVYEKIRLVLKPFGKNWDNPADDDLILRNAT